MKTVNFLDVTFDIENMTYKPYSKPGSTHLYVHIQSNHPHLITQQIPQSIEARLTCNLSSKEFFESSKPEYKEALQKAGYKTKLNYGKKH